MLYEWLAADDEGLIAQNDGPFKQALDRYKYPNRFPDEDCSNMFETGAEILKDLNARIEQNGALVTDENTLADFAIFPFIRQFRNVDQERFANLELKALSNWLDVHLESDLFKTIMEKYEPWKPQDTPVIFGQDQNAACAPA